jgi:hypothetical protein
MPVEEIVGVDVSMDDLSVPVQMFVDKIDSEQ